MSLQTAGANPEDTRSAGTGQIPEQGCIAPKEHIGDHPLTMLQRQGLGPRAGRMRSRMQEQAVLCTHSEQIGASGDGVPSSIARSLRCSQLGCPACAAGRTVRASRPEGSMAAKARTNGGADGVDLGNTAERENNSFPTKSARTSTHTSQIRSSSLNLRSANETLSPGFVLAGLGGGASAATVAKIRWRSFLQTEQDSGSPASLSS